MWWMGEMVILLLIFSLSVFDSSLEIKFSKLMSKNSKHTNKYIEIRLGIIKETNILE